MRELQRKVLYSRGAMTFVRNECDDPDVRSNDDYIDSLKLPETTLFGVSYGFELSPRVSWWRVCVARCEWRTGRVACIVLNGRSVYLELRRPRAHADRFHLQSPSREKIVAPSGLVQNITVLGQDFARACSRNLLRRVSTE